MPKHRLDGSQQVGGEAGAEGAVEPAEDTTPDTAQDSSGQDAQVGDAPNPLERGRSEDPPPDGVGYDGAPVEEIQEERARRLAPENRPPNTEVDNSQREFDPEKAMFVDEPGHEDAPKIFPPVGEQGA